MCSATDENDCGRRTASAQRLPMRHTKGHPISERGELHEGDLDREINRGLEVLAREVESGSSLYSELQRCRFSRVYPARPLRGVPPKWAGLKDRRVPQSLRPLDRSLASCTSHRNIGSIAASPLTALGGSRGLILVRRHRLASII